MMIVKKHGSTLPLLVLVCLSRVQAATSFVIPPPSLHRTAANTATSSRIIIPQILVNTPQRRRQQQDVSKTTFSTITTACNMLPVRGGVWSLLWIWGIFSSIKIVNQGNVAIVERLGKFHQCLEPGLHVTIPIVDRIATRITEREQVFDIPPQKCITLDNAPLEADAVVYWKIVAPSKAFYSVVDLELAIQNLVLTQLRSEIGKLTLDATFSAREQINSVLLQDLDVATEPWGVKITRVEVRDIVPNSEIMAAMEMQMAAERTKRALIIKSEGEKSRAVNEAEGDAQSRIIDAKAKAESVLLKAEAEAKRLELEAEGATKSLLALKACLGNAQEAAKFQLSREYLDAQRSLATSSNAKVILSSDNVATDPLVKALSIYDSSN